MIGGSIEAAAIARADDAHRLSGAMEDFGREAAGARVVIWEGLAALTLRSEASFWRTRKKAGKALVQRQRLLEAAHAAAPILPCAPGAGFSSMDALRAFLAANAEMLNDGLVRYGDLEQHQIMIGLPFQTALARMRTREDWAEIERVGATAQTAEEKRAFGARLAAAAEELRVGLYETAVRLIAEAAQDFERLPEGDDGVAVNLVALTPRSGGGGVEAALEEIDAAWSGALKIKLIGPSPATSFASVMVEDVDPAAAAAELGLPITAAPADVDAAYRKIMKSVHPDRAGDANHERAARLNAAKSLMRRSAAARESLVTAGFLASREARSTPVALARLYREGQPDAR